MKQILLSSVLLLTGFSLRAQSSGLSSVFQLKSNQTLLVKSDYLPFGSAGVKIQLPQGLSLEDETAETFILSGKLVRAIDNIRLIVKADTVDIPCRRSRKLSTNITVELAAPVKKLGVKGSYNAWQVDEKNVKPIGTVPTKNWTIENIEGNEGYHQFKLVADGKETDPVNIPVTGNGMGGTNAVLKLGEPDGVLPRISADSAAANKLALSVEQGEYCLVYWNNRLFGNVQVKPSSVMVVELPGYITKSKGRSYIRVFVGSQTRVGNDLLIPLENGHIVTNTAELKRTDHHTQIMYFMMVDRFANGDVSNDPEPLESVLPKAQYLGGDLKGIQQKMASGFFDGLGVNTIWLSPVSQNPQGAWGLWNKQVTTKFSAYHGYWPTSYSKVDARFGNNQLFGDVITTAHTKNTNIILDFVAHHVHIDHPLYKLHPDWVTPLYLPDGTMNTERWDDHRLTTWFDTFLPTLNFEEKKVRELVADSVLFWVKNYELDGFRHDASKHVPEEFWRLLTQKIKIEQRKKAEPAFYQIGETYGSPELIGSYVNSGEMDAQFDFNVYDASVGAFTTNVSNTSNYWEGLKRTLNESFDYYGWHHLMGNISGNQDRPRFASLADGSVRGDEDTKLAGWTREIHNTNEKGFKRMAQLMALNMTLPGVPVIYYGDEYAMPGGNDPDNRRMMQFEGYNANQLGLIYKVKQLTTLRKSNMALLYGDYKLIETNPAFFAYERNYFGQRVVVVFSKNAGRVKLPMTNTMGAQALFFHSFNKGKEAIEVEMRADDVEIFIFNKK